MPNIEAEKQESAFREYRSRAWFTDQQADALLQEKGAVVSMACRKAEPDQFLVKFATALGTFGPYSLNRLVATQLRHSLQEEGF